MRLKHRLRRLAAVCVVLAVAGAPSALGEPSGGGSSRAAGEETPVVPADVGGGQSFPCGLDHGANAVYYPGTSNVALIAIHRSQDFRVLGNLFAPHAVQRGFHVLLQKSRFPDDASVDWEAIALDLRASVRCMRSLPTIDTVLLVGWSGGGPASAYYQAVAENGASFCQMPQKLTTCSDKQMTGWVESDQADGIVFVDAHDGTNTLFKLNGALVDEDDPDSIDPNLDPFSEANGYDPDGVSQYSPGFVADYWDGQAARMNRLIDDALEMREEIQQGTRDPDDDAFEWHRVGGRLQEITPQVLGCTSEPRTLLRHDGTLSDPRTVCTVRNPEPGDDEGTSETLTVTSFLSYAAIRVSPPSPGAQAGGQVPAHGQGPAPARSHRPAEIDPDDGDPGGMLDRIEWCSSNYSVACALRHVSVPILVVPAQAHYFIWDNEVFYDNAASADKTFIVVEGMTHGLTGCADCGGGPYLNASSNLWDFVEEWAATRY